MAPMPLALRLLAGCDPGEPPPETTCDPARRGATERLPVVLPHGADGVAVWGGRLHVASPEVVLRLEDGLAEPVVSLNAARGLAASPAGLWVANPGTFTFDGGGLDGALVLVTPDRAARAVARGLANPEGVAVAPWGEVLVSDPTRDGIVAVDPDTGEVRPFAEVPSPNGLALSPDGAWLYATSTYQLPPPLWRIPVGEGDAGAPEEVVRLPTGSGPDGVAVDAEGWVWVAMGTRGELARVDPETGEVQSVAVGLESPASLAFGAAPDTDPCSVYLTELRGRGVVRVEAGIGAP